MRQLELERLDADWLALQERAAEGDTQAISTRLRISERRCRLLGLDAPNRMQVEADTKPEPVVSFGLREIIRRAHEIEEERRKSADES